jgi:hypothetical protein
MTGGGVVTAFGAALRTARRGDGARVRDDLPSAEGSPTISVSPDAASSCPSTTGSMTRVGDDVAWSTAVHEATTVSTTVAPPVAIHSHTRTQPGPCPPSTAPREVDE